MKFEPGRPKTGGRKKGSKNLRNGKLSELLDEYGVEPLKRLLELMDQLEPRDQVNAYKELLPYLYAKKRPAEESDEKEDVQTVLEDMRTLLEHHKERDGEPQP